MRKLLIFTFSVFLPALIVGISNFSVFPDSSLIATIMLVITAGVAGVFTYFSGDATAKVRHYCVIADIGICIVLCVNLGGHWILAREVSAAKQGVEERHTEEDREDKRKAAETERQLALKKADLELQEIERRRLRLLPRSERRSSLSTPTPAPVSVMAPMSLISTNATISAPMEKMDMTPRLTPDQVRARWWWFLTGLAIAECAASVLAGVILAAVWQWDRNHDGIADHLQTPGK